MEETVKPTTMQLDILKLRIPYDSNVFESENKYNLILSQLLDDSKNIALSDLYPFIDWSEKDLPKRLRNWQIRACVELYHFLGTEGVKSYSENGLSWTKLKEGLSSDLENEIIPEAGYITKKVPEEV